MRGEGHERCEHGWKTDAYWWRTLLGGSRQLISNENILQCSHLTLPLFTIQESWAHFTLVVFI